MKMLELRKEVLDRKLEECRKYVSKTSLLGDCPFVFLINTDLDSLECGLIHLVFTLSKKYTKLKIPDFVDKIGYETNSIKMQYKKYTIESAHNITYEEFESSKKYSKDLSFSDVETVILGKNVAHICSGAFLCSKVKRVEINSDLKIIGEESFLHCGNLKEINLENMDSESIISKRAFMNCEELNKVDLSNVVDILDQAFYNCTKLKNVIFPTNNKYNTIESRTFQLCESIEEIYIPDNVEYIKDLSFFGSNRLNKIRIGKNIKFLGAHCFKTNDYMYNERNVIIENDDIDKIEIENNVFRANKNNGAYVEKIKVNILHNGKEIDIDSLKTKKIEMWGGSI